jgi:hypothetical protein
MPSVSSTASASPPAQASSISAAACSASCPSCAPDSAAWVIDPPHPAWQLLLTEVFDVYPRTGRDFHTGRRAARLLRDAGLRDVQVRVLARVTAPGDYFQTFLLTLATLMRQEILAGARLTPGQLDASIAELRQHLSQPGTLTCLPTIWQAWGSKPGAR